LPKPDLVFFLYADPQVLMKRKPQENTLERSKADLIKFRKVAETVSSGNYISIDTSGLTIDEARDLILSEIYKSHKVYDNLLTAKFY
jgi:thymidylate kinase